MGNFLTSFIFSVSVSVWAYNKFQRRTGGISQKSATAAAVIGVMAFIFFYSLIVFLTNLIES